MTPPRGKSGRKKKKKEEKRKRFRYPDHLTELVVGALKQGIARNDAEDLTRQLAQRFSGDGEKRLQKLQDHFWSIIDSVRNTNPCCLVFAHRKPVRRFLELEQDRAAGGRMRRIAAAALAELEPGDRVVFDGFSVTVASAAAALVESQVRLTGAITYGLLAFCELLRAQEQGVLGDLSMAGGEFNVDNLISRGPETEERLKAWNPTKCVLGLGGIDAKGKLYGQLEDRNIMETILGLRVSTILVFDHSKWTPQNFVYGTLEDLERSTEGRFVAITNELPDDADGSLTSRFNAVVKPLQKDYGATKIRLV